MRDKDQQEWMNRSDQIKIQPSYRVWRRLESRLDQDQDKIRLSNLRSTIMVAATILLIFTCSIYFWLPQSTNTSEIHLQDLTMVVPQPDYATYHHVSDINSFYRDHDWRSIVEGEHKPLRPSPQRSAENN